MAGFIQTPLAQKTLIVPNDFRHGMATGETGCGKTSSFILPNIKDRLEKNHGMFILDYKGSLHSQVKALAKDANRLEDIVEIGVPWGQSFGFLKGVGENLFLESLEHLLGDETDKFWSTSSLSMIGLFVKSMALMDHIHELSIQVGIEEENPYGLSLDNLITIVQSVKELKSFCKQMERICVNFSEDTLIENYSKKYHRELALIFQYAQKLQDNHKRISSFESTIDEEKPSSGSGGVFFQMRSMMMALDASGLSGDNDLLDILDEGKIVLLRCDSFSPRLTVVLMHILYTRLAKRVTCNRAISLFVDEFQRSVTKDSLPFVDVFREKRVELIAAMQNIEQLEIQIGEKEAKAFMGNMVHQYSYKDDEEFDCEHKNSTCKAVPIFLKQKDIDESQLAWQELLPTRFRLSRGWVYVVPIDATTCKIRHVKTGEMKLHHLLEDTRKFEKMLKVFGLSSQFTRTFEESA